MTWSKHLERSLCVGTNRSIAKISKAALFFFCKNMITNRVDHLDEIIIQIQHRKCNYKSSNRAIEIKQSIQNISNYFTDQNWYGERKKDQFTTRAHKWQKKKILNQNQDARVNFWFRFSEMTAKPPSPTQCLPTPLARGQEAHPRYSRRSTLKPARLPDSSAAPASPIKFCLHGGGRDGGENGGWRARSELEARARDRRPPSPPLGSTSSAVIAAIILKLHFLL
jgi:hypothetical protein